MNNTNIHHSQNFLTNNTLVKELINISGITKDDLILEIGSGKGIITYHLADKLSKIVAIEYDKELFELLRKKFDLRENVEIIFGDFLKIELPRIPYKIFSNIPFNITSQILAKITTLDSLMMESFLIIQEEAAKKYCGFPYYNESLRSLMIKPFYKLDIIHKFRKTDFSPVPNVNIVFLKISKREYSIIENNSFDKYSDFISYVFLNHGKDLKERLKKILTYEQYKRLSNELNFKIDAKPIEVNFEQWIGLFKYFIIGVSKEKQAIIFGASKKLIEQQLKLDKIHRNRKF